MQNEDESRCNKCGQSLCSDSYTISAFAKLAILVVLGSLTVGSFPYIVNAFIRSDDKPLQASALLGDSFGFVNSMLSALAFAGVLFTIWMQREELRLQRLEQSETRKEHSRSADAQEKSISRSFLASYLSTLDAIRQFEDSEVMKDRAVPTDYAGLHSIISLERTRETLERLAGDLRKEVLVSHPNLNTSKGTNDFLSFAEQIEGIYLQMRETKQLLDIGSGKDVIESIVVKTKEIVAHLESLQAADPISSNPGIPEVVAPLKKLFLEIDRGKIQQQFVQERLVKVLNYSMQLTLSALASKFAHLRS